MANNIRAELDRLVTTVQNILPERTANDDDRDNREREEIRRRNETNPITQEYGATIRRYGS